MKADDKRKVYLSLSKGFHVSSPLCFRCGDCCMRIPAEVTEEDLKLLRSKLTETDRRLLEDSLTTDPTVADPIDGVKMPLSKAAWIKAPCCFLQFEKGRRQNNQVRASCRIYSIRPEICRIFHCGKTKLDEPLLPANYEYEMTPNYTRFIEEEIRKSAGDKGVQETRDMIKKAKETTQ